MPNWCYTNHALEGDEKEIQTLYNIMSGLERKKPIVDTDFGPTWLGNLVDALGEDWHKIRCRGSFSELSYEKDGTLRFNAETAWCPAYEVFDLIEKKFPSIKIYYMAEESGCGLYETNDHSGVYFNDRFYIDMCNKDEYDFTYARNEKEALRWVNEMTSQHFTTLEEVEVYGEKMGELCEDSYLYIHEYKLV